MLWVTGNRKEKEKEKEKDKKEGKRRRAGMGKRHAVVGDAYKLYGGGRRHSHTHTCLILNFPHTHPASPSQEMPTHHLLPLPL